MLIAPDYLSPSSIATFEQCPLRYKYSRIDGLAEPPTEATIFGNFVHSILERFYELVPKERTTASARLIASTVWQEYEEDVRQILRNDATAIHAFRWKAWWCIENLMKMEVPAEQQFGGIETALDATIAGVRIKGFVDRWGIDDIGNVTIGDYKTGKVPRAPWIKDKFDQLLIYGIILSNELGKELGRLELLYVTHTVRAAHIPTADDIQRVSEKIVSVRSAIDEKCITGDFEPKKSTLCSWCHFKPMCPAWATNR